MVHITISDFQLNLDPTADDVWTLNGADGTSHTYRNATDWSHDLSFGNDDTGVFGIQSGQTRRRSCVCRWSNPNGSDN